MPPLHCRRGDGRLRPDRAPPVGLRIPLVGRHRERRRRPAWRYARPATGRASASVPRLGGATRAWWRSARSRRWLPVPEMFAGLFTIRLARDSRPCRLSPVTELVAAVRRVERAWCPPGRGERPARRRHQRQPGHRRHPLGRPAPRRRMPSGRHSLDLPTKPPDIEGVHLRSSFALPGMPRITRQRPACRSSWEDLSPAAAPTSPAPRGSAAIRAACCCRRGCRGARLHQTGPLAVRARRRHRGRQGRGHRHLPVLIGGLATTGLLLPRARQWTGHHGPAARPDRRHAGRR